MDGVAAFRDHHGEIRPKMKRKGRKVLMFIDNCSAHPGLEDKLEVTKLVFFPPNTTSVLQPMDQGIIQAIKSQYRHRIVEKILTSVGDDALGDSPAITLLDAVNLVSSAWKSVSPETISKCFRKAGLKKTADPDITAQGEVTEPVVARSGIFERMRTVSGGIRGLLANRWQCALPRRKSDRRADH